LPEDNPSGIWGKGWICAAVPVRVVNAPVTAVAFGIDLLTEVVTTVTITVDQDRLKEATRAIIAG
jgi:hypothetical protein